MKKRTNKKTRRWHFLIYIIIGGAGVGLIIASFYACGNWSNVLSGVGTGLLTSLCVTVLIEMHHKREQVNKNISDKKLFLHDITYCAEDIYIDILHRMNEFQLDYYKDAKWLSKLYDDTSKYIEFLDKVATIDLSIATPDEKKQIDTLFNIHSFRLDGLIGELKKFPKEQLYLSGILNKVEYENIVSNHYNELYMNCINNLTRFWDFEVIDLKECIRFTKMTLLICTKIIKSVDFCRKSVVNKETYLLNYLDEQYFYKVYSKSDEYIEQEIEEARARDEYYANHTDEYAKLFEDIEDNNLSRDINCAIWCSSIEKIAAVLESSEEWDKESFELLCDSKIAQKLMKDKQLKNLFYKKFQVKYKPNLKWNDVNNIITKEQDGESVASI